VIFYGPGNEGKTTLVRLLSRIAPVKRLSSSLVGGTYHYGPRPVFYECEPDGSIPSVDTWMRELKGETLVVQTNVLPDIQDDRVVVLTFTRSHQGEVLELTDAFVEIVKNYLCTWIPVCTVIGSGNDIYTDVMNVRELAEAYGYESAHALRRALSKHLGTRLVGTQLLGVFTPKYLLKCLECMR